MKSRLTVAPETITESKVVVAAELRGIRPAQNVEEPKFNIQGVEAGSLARPYHNVSIYTMGMRI